MLTTTAEKIAALGQGANSFSNPDRRNKFSQKAWERYASPAPGSALDSTFPILAVFKEFGLADALWCLETIDVQQGHDRDLALFGLAICHHYVEPNIDCQLTIAAINAAEQYANGLASRDAVHDALGKAEDAAKRRKLVLLATDNISSSKAIDQLACIENALVIVGIRNSLCMTTTDCDFTLDKQKGSQ